MTPMLNTIAERLANANITLQYRDSSILNFIHNNEDYNAVAAKVGDEILNIVANIKNKQKPVYDSFRAMVKEEIDASSNLTELADYSVITFKLSDVVKAFYTKHIIPEKPGALNVVPSSNINFELPDVSLIKSAFTYEQDAELNTMVNALLEKYSPTDLINIFNSYVARPDMSNPLYTNRVDINSDDPDAILLAVCALIKLRTAQPATVAVSPKEYVTGMTACIDALLNKLSLACYEANSRIERNQLVITGNTEQKKIYVQDEVYSTFLSNGGTIEVILGMLVTGTFEGADRLLESITAKASDYQKAWTNLVNIVRVSNTQNEIKRYKVAYVIAMTKLMDTVLPENFDYGQGRNFILKGVDEILSILNEETISNIGKTCQILLSKLIFPNTKFEEFTQDMLDIANSAPGISGSDAASAASIKMLIRYLVENLSALQK